MFFSNLANTEFIILLIPLTGVITVCTCGNYPMHTSFSFGGFQSCPFNCAVCKVFRKFIAKCSEKDKFTLKAPMVTNINFLLTISIPCLEIRLWEVMKWSLKRRSFDLLSNSLNCLFKEMYRHQFGEFVHGYWGLKG